MPLCGNPTAKGTSVAAAEVKWRWSNDSAGSGKLNLRNNGNRGTQSQG